MDIYITCLLQRLSFPSSFRRFEIKTNHGGRQYFLIGSPPRIFFISAGLCISNSTQNQNVFQPTTRNYWVLVL